MPKLCKPTKEAIFKRKKALERHGRIYGYVPWDVPSPCVYGLDESKMTHQGAFTIEDLIKEIKLQSN